MPLRLLSFASVALISTLVPLLLFLASALTYAQEYSDYHEISLFDPAPYYARYAPFRAAIEISDTSVILEGIREMLARLEDIDTASMAGCSQCLSLYLTYYEDEMSAGAWILNEANTARERLSNHLQWFTEYHAEASERLYGETTLELLDLYRLHTSSAVCKDLWFTGRGTFIPLDLLTSEMDAWLTGQPFFQVCSPHVTDTDSPQYGVIQRIAEPQSPHSRALRDLFVSCDELRTSVDSGTSNQWEGNLIILYENWD